MKKVLSIFVLGLALLMVSCNKEDPIMTGPINEINDLYTVPAGAVELPSVTGSSTWATDRRYFDLSFGNALTTTLVGYDALLAPGQYLLGPDEIGKAILSKTKVNGAAAKAGYILVNEKDGKYTIIAQIDGNTLAWTGELPFKADPAAKKLTQLLQAQSNVANGTNSLTLQLATDGISSEFDMTTYQTVWKGEGGYLALDIYSDDGYLHDGNYKACAVGGQINPGEFGIGYDTTQDWGWGPMEVKDWGTCWWTVSGGAATAEKITGGLVKVSSEEVGDEVIWTIAWGEKYPQEMVFTGAIKALTKPKKPSGPVELNYTYTIGEPQVCILSDNTTVVEGVKKYPITIVDAANQEVAYLEFVLADGSNDVVEGDYVSTEYAHEVGQLANGYYMDFGDWGVFAGGSYYVADGEKVYIGAGETVMVTQVATGAFRFTGSGFDYAAAGPNYVPGGEGGEGGDDVSGDVVLKITSGLTYTMEDVTASNTDASQNPLTGMTLWRVTVSDGNGTVAAFDLGTSAGSSDLAGTYTVMSYPDAVGKAGNGWGIAMFNMFGGCYFVANGSYYFIPADATISVSANGDGTLKFRFEGPIQKDDYSDGGTGGLLLNNVAKS